jgi:hypothetical protein
MASATVRAPKSGNEKGRPVAGRPLINSVSNDVCNDSATTLRLQLLTRRLGLTDVRARLVSSMAWEAAA